MQRPTYYRFLIAGMLTISCYCFMFVNHAGNGAVNTQIVRTELYQESETEANDQAKSLPIPDLTVINKVIDLLQKWI
jgi:hypothetical protein